MTAVRIRSVGRSSSPRMQGRHRARLGRRIPIPTGLAAPVTPGIHVVPPISARCVPLWRNAAIVAWYRRDVYLALLPLRRRPIRQEHESRSRPGSRHSVPSAALRSRHRERDYRGIGALHCRLQRSGLFALGASPKRPTPLLVKYNSPPEQALRQSLESAAGRPFLSIGSELCAGAAAPHSFAPRNAAGRLKDLRAGVCAVVVR